MESSQPVGIVIGCLLLIVVSTIGLISPQAIWQLSSWRYRDASAMEPTEGQYRVHRARYAAMFSLSVPPLIGLAWPGDFDLKLRVWMFSAVASVIIIIAVLVLVSLMRRKARQATIDHNRPSELSSAGYGAEWLAVAYTFFYVLLIVGVFAGLQSSLEHDRQEAIDRQDHTLTPEQERLVQETLDRISSSLPTATPPSYAEATGLTVYTAVPDGLFVGAAGVRMQTNDAGENRLVAPENVCPVVGIVVVESSVNVSLGFAYDPSAAGSADPAGYCVKVKGSSFTTAAFPVVLGERVALSLAGDKLTGGKF